MRHPIRTARRRLRRSSTRRRILIASGVGLLLAAFVVIVVLVGGGGGESETGPLTQVEVANTLDLSPDPSGNGWITLDGTRTVVSIDIGSGAQAGDQPANPSVEATNETSTVRAAVLSNTFSITQAACVDRISSALRDH